MPVLALFFSSNAPEERVEALDPLTGSRIRIVFDCRTADVPAQNDSTSQMPNDSARFSPGAFQRLSAPLGDRAGALVGGYAPINQVPDLHCGRRCIAEDLVLDFPPVRRPLSPGASVGAVCPPAFTIPTSLSVLSGRLSQPRTIFKISTSAPSTESFTCLTSFFHLSPGS